MIARRCEPSSELHIAEDWYRKTALEDILELAPERLYDNRLYRALDRLLPHKEAIERHLKKRLGELFDLDYDLLLYDVTAPTSRARCALTRWLSAATAAITALTASRCASHWW
jgi:hypothetical protein